jgi:hypothetical protein
MGVSVGSLKAALDDNVTDSRKMDAYEAWGILDTDGEKVSLNAAAKELTDEESRATYFRNLITEMEPYHTALDKAYTQQDEVLTATEVGNLWSKYFKNEIGTDSNETLRSMVTCFFNVAEEAGIGDYIMGRGGKSTRLEIHREALASFIEDDASDPDQDTEDEVTSESGETSPNPSEDGRAKTDDGGASNARPMERRGEAPQEEERNGLSPSLNIDIEIHIPPEADSEQIDQIFESMSKHLGYL